MRTSALMENRILYFVIALICLGLLLEVVRVVRFVMKGEHKESSDGRGSRFSVRLLVMLGTIALSLGLICFFILDPVWLDKTILMEEMRPDYWMRLGSAKTRAPWCLTL